MAAILAVLVTGTPPASAAATGGPCKPGASANTTIQITDPIPRSTIDLGKRPKFDVKGWVRPSGRDPVTRIDVYGDQTLIGRATLGAQGSGPTRADQAWTVSGSSPPGSHVLTACAITASGAVAGAAGTFSAIAPPPDATVLAADTRVLQSAHRAALTTATADTLTFAGKVDFGPGQILLSAPTPAAPEGLMRRIIALKANPTTTVLTTRPASLEEAVLQAKINMESVPLAPADPASTGEVGAAAMQAVLPTIDWSGNVKFDSEATPRRRPTSCSAQGACRPLTSSPIPVEATRLDGGRAYRTTDSKIPKPSGLCQRRSCARSPPAPSMLVAPKARARASKRLARSAPVDATSVEHRAFCLDGAFYAAS